MFKRCLKFEFFILAIMLVFSAKARQVVSVSSADVNQALCPLLEGYDKPHPRLLVDGSENFEKIKDKVLNSDTGSLWNNIYEKRVVALSREMMASAVVYKMTGDSRCLDMVKNRIEQLCGGEAWESYYMLSSAGYTKDLGFLYDLLYEELDVSFPGSSSTYRDKVKETIITKGLNPYLVQYQRGNDYLLNNGYVNWNHQMNAGAIIGALAVLDADTDDLVRNVLVKAIPSLSLGIKAMEPNGFWDEGVSYFLTSVLNPVVEALTALNNSFGTDFGLSDCNGLKASGAFPMYVTGPTGFPLGYGDTHAERARWAAGGGLFWLGKRFDKPVYIQDEISGLETYNSALKGTGWSSLFFIPFTFADEGNIYADMPLDVFYGEVGNAGTQSQFALFRSNWNDTNALFGSLKGGHTANNHQHLDLGAFELQALGEQWTVELGYGDWVSDYSVDTEHSITSADLFRDYGYFQDAGARGNRWNIYNVSARSHNVPLVNNNNQGIDAAAVFDAFSSETNQAFAVLDLTEAYAGQGIQKIRRGMKMMEGRNAFLIQDEFTSSSTQDLAWGMSTDADVCISKDGRTATLIKNGKNVVFKILDSTNTPPSVVFSSRVPAIGLDITTPVAYTMQGRWRSRVSNETVNMAQIEQNLAENRAAGFKRLLIELPQAQGNITLPIWVVPNATGNESAPVVLDLDQW